MVNVFFYFLEKSTNKAAYLSVIGGIVFVLLLLIVYLVWKIRKEKQFRKELAAAGLLYFTEGVTKSLNPDLGIDEQAELLPYDDRFEYPAEKLHLGITTFGRYDFITFGLRTTYFVICLPRQSDI